MLLLLRAAALVLAAAAFAAPARAFDVHVLPPSPRQGDAVALLVSAPGVRAIEGQLAGRPLAFFPYGDQRAALVGIDLTTNPGPIGWHVGLVDGDGAPHARSGTIVVRPRDFPVQRLTLPPSMVDLDPATERRAEAEAARLRALYATSSPARLWSGPFARPVSVDRDGTGFGARRIINGQPRMPHSGVDYAAERGAPVRAANRGRVVLVDDFFFAGRLVVLDHGLGLYTLYMHLDRADVSVGALVERGQRLGAVGSTGRATGPHLHWAAVLGQARIDPVSLLGLPLTE